WSIGVIRIWRTHRKNSSTIGYRIHLIPEHNTDFFRGYGVNGICDISTGSSVIGFVQVTLVRKSGDTGDCALHEIDQIGKVAIEGQVEGFAIIYRFVRLQFFESD